MHNESVDLSANSFDSIRTSVFVRSIFDSVRDRNRFRLNRIGRTSENDNGNGSAKAKNKCIVFDARVVVVVVVVVVVAVVIVVRKKIAEELIFRRTKIFGVKTFVWLVAVSEDQFVAASSYLPCGGCQGEIRGWRRRRRWRWRRRRWMEDQVIRAGGSILVHPFRCGLCLPLIVDHDHLVDMWHH